jgi:peptide/nickel transport system substrate-binding protein
LTAGCGRKAEVSPGILRLAWSSDPASLDPAAAVDVVAGAAVALLYEGLVTIDHEGRVAPSLARSWDIDDSGTTYTFHLDPEAKASDGSKVGASQVEASWLRLLDPKNPSPRAWVLEAIQGAGEYVRGEASSVSGLNVVSEDTLSVRLSRPRASFLGLLAMPNAAVLSSSQDAGGTVSTGPWVLTERVAASHLKLRRNPHWHGTAPAFEEIHLRILHEEFTRVAEFEVGNLDVLEVPASQAKRFREDPATAPRLQRQIAHVTEYIGLNNEHAVLSDARVRRALNHAVHVQRIMDTILEGRGVRSMGAIPPAIPGGREEGAYEYDPEKARALLAEAKVPTDWKLEIWQRPSPVVSQVLEAVQADLRAVGVHAEILQRDWGALKASIDRGDTPAFYINWYADYPDPENFLVPLFHSSNIGGGGNRARFRDAAVDSMLTALESERDPQARETLAGAVDARVHEQAPWIYLWHPMQEVVTSPRVKDYRPHPVSSCERWIEISPAEGASAR